MAYPSPTTLVLGLFRNTVSSLEPPTDTARIIKPYNTMVLNILPIKLKRFEEKGWVNMNKETVDTDSSLLQSVSCSSQDLSSSSQSTESVSSIKSRGRRKAPADRNRSVKRVFKSVQPVVKIVKLRDDAFNQYLDTDNNKANLICYVKDSNRIKTKSFTTASSITWETNDISKDSLDTCSSSGVNGSFNSSSISANLNESADSSVSNGIATKMFYKCSFNTEIGMEKMSSPSSRLLNDATSPFESNLNLYRKIINSPDTLHRQDNSSQQQGPSKENTPPSQSPPLRKSKRKTTKQLKNEKLQMIKTNIMKKEQGGLMVIYLIYRMLLT